MKMKNLLARGATLASLGLFLPRSGNAAYLIDSIDEVIFNYDHTTPVFESGVYLKNNNFYVDGNAVTVEINEATNNNLYVRWAQD